MSTDYSDLPLVYSCSGCSSAAQMANDIAIALDREKNAEMSCIAGVGGGVAPLVETATSGRDIIAIDGCPLECTKQCLARHDVTPDEHYMLAEEAVTKEYHADYDEDQFDAVLADIRDDLASGTRRQSAADRSRAVPASEPTDHEEATGTRVWMVERTYSTDAPNIMVITYATLDGSAYLVQERAFNRVIRHSDPAVTAARDVATDDLSSTPDEETRERYAAEARRMRERHDPDDEV